MKTYTAEMTKLVVLCCASELKAQTIGANSGGFGNAAPAASSQYSVTLTGSTQASISSTQPDGVGGTKSFASTVVGVPTTVQSPARLLSPSFGGSQSGGPIGYGFGASYSVVPTMPSSGVLQLSVEQSAFSIVGVNKPVAPGTSISLDVTSTVDIVIQHNSPGFAISNDYLIGAKATASITALADGAVRVRESLNASESTGSATQLSSGVLKTSDLVSIWPKQLAEGILKNSMDVFPNPNDNNATMIALFSPKDGSTLGTAANALGFDHWNIRQTITHIPVGWKYELVDANGEVAWRADVDGNGGVHGFVNLANGTRRPALDPIDDLNLHPLFSPPGNLASTVDPVAIVLGESHGNGGALDSHPFVLGEDRSLASLSGNLYYPGKNGFDAPMVRYDPKTGLPISAGLSQATELRFSDKPSLGTRALSAMQQVAIAQGLGSNLRSLGFYMGFESALVGVTADGREVDLPSGLGVKWTWDSDTVTSVIDSKFYIPTNGDLSESIYGGVFNIALDRSSTALPEGGGYGDMAAVLILMAIVRKRWVIQ